MIVFKKKNDENILETSQWIPRPVSEVFRFFSLETNLERLTPSFLNFKVLKKSSEQIQQGTLIDYTLKLSGIPMQWQTHIETWIPNERFVDVQVKGPYALWHHTHIFTPKDDGTLMEDRVRYVLPFGELGKVVAGWYVRRDLEKIFTYRFREIHKIFPPMIGQVS